MIDYSILIYIFLASIIINLLIIYLGNKISFEKKLNIQNIHTGFVPRISVINILPLIVFLNYYLDLNLTLFLLIAPIIIIPGLIEDIGLDISPNYRFFFLILGSLFLVIGIHDLPIFDFKILNKVVNNSYFQILFFTLALATVINGQNIIDGTNGLSAFTSITIFGSLLYLGLYLNDLILIKISSSIIVILIAFLIFNYPKGRIFLGDSSCYFLGALAGYLVIKTFGEHKTLPSWSAVIILYYPTWEVIFSYFRKLLNKKSPFQPDNKHLHLKIYLMLSHNKLNFKKYNSLVAPFLSIIWLTPFALLPLSIVYPHLSMSVLILLILIYLFFYFSIPEPE